MFDAIIYTERREKLKIKLGSGVVLLLGNEESGMNYRDNWYPFRQDSTFLYYFGLNQASLAAVIDIDENREVIYGDELTVEDIVWTGTQPTIREKANSCNVNHTAPLNDLIPFLKNAQSKNRKIHFLPPYRPENKLKLMDWLEIHPTEVKEKASIPLVKAVVAQRSIKSPEEIQELDKAVSITAKMHRRAMEIARPGMKEKEIAALLMQIARSEGLGLSFPPITTINGQTLHNTYYENTLTNDHMLLVDAGAETTMNYAGDMTRTFPVRGYFKQQEKEIYEIVLNSINAAADMLQPGILHQDVYFRACEVIVEGLKDLGIMQGDPQEAVQAGAHALFFPCGLGHMMGLDIHDMEDLGEEYVGYDDKIKKGTQFGLKSLRLGKKLEPGFVLTTEPGIYFIPELTELWKAEGKFTDFINYEKLKSYSHLNGFRIEDNYVITEKGKRLLGDPVPKTVEEVEKCRKSSSQEVPA
ncbi:aminopeptidase P family protein [Xanthovirga aplysinae]|uniref:aminopeptidase P family protein n=1 Tax=Xanthovirga aplysinae TaxID=2529853 RepID=UPI0012BB92BE|nr:aminopeptidase P family protein [Xanthovirga aplysinae]MTI32061.1 aminopeptidase P family protein [Xanthovirga aplysinae]